MSTLEPFAMIHTTDQWHRAAHTDTALDVERGIVQLAWQTEAVSATDADAPDAAGLAFDPWCRLYRSLPGQGRVERLLWDHRDSPGNATDLFYEPPASVGEFSLIDTDAGPLDTPRGLAVDDQGRLFVAEAGAQRVLIYDLVERRLLRSLEFDGSPQAMATDGARVVVALARNSQPWSLYSLTATTHPVEIALPEATMPGAVALAGDGRVFIIDQAGTAGARLIALDAADDAIDIAFATDVVFVDDDVAVVARAPGSDFVRFRIDADGDQSQLPHFNAPGYDGRGIALGPDGRVVYWTANGLAAATLARVKFVGNGRVVSFRLDAGQFQTRWGRLFIDACIPQGTAIRVHCLTADEVPDTPSVALTPPANSELATIYRPDLSPPLPPLEFVDGVEPAQVLHRRTQGNEMPWQCDDDSGFATYEAPVIAPPGRYLWLVIDLIGKSHTTPKIGSVRVQYPDRDLLRRLPRLFSQNESAANFLQRYLAMTETGLHELDQLAGFRHLLLDPDVSPVAMLPWLGSLLGMELDQRWSERAQREILANAIWLYRYRGTVAGLRRFIEIYLGIDDLEIAIVEHFKVRGLGGAFVGVDDALAANSVLGAGFRVGGKLGVDATQSIGEVSLQDAITTHAHRFSVIVPLLLDNEQRAVIEHILEVHRPAHTIFDICSVDAGMRLGTGLHLGLTSIVGLSSGFGRLQIGGSVLGRGDVLGRPRASTSIGNSRLGANTRVG